MPTFFQITVDGRRYQWALSADSSTVYVRSALRAGQELEVAVTSKWPVRPPQVARMVRDALRAGWKPTTVTDGPFQLIQSS